jgi:periplasmic protein TonB
MGSGALCLSVACADSARTPVPMNFDHSRHHLFGALLISALLHLILVFGWGWARPLPPSLPQPAMQVVVSAKPMAPAAVPFAPAVPFSPAMPEKVLPAVTKRQEPSLNKPILASPASPTEFAPAPAGQASPEMAVPSLPVGSAKAKPENEGISGGVSAEGLRQYRIELAGAARRFRIYPALARSRGWEGVAEVSIAVHAGVPSPSVKLVKSSGYEVLDEQALDMLSRAVAATPLPESLQGRSFVVPMPIRFSLEE